MKLIKIVELYQERTVISYVNAERIEYIREATYAMGGNTKIEGVEIQFIDRDKPNYFRTCIDVVLESLARSCK